MDLGCILRYLVAVYTFILFVRIIFSWVTMAWTPPPSLTPVIRILYDITEPVMAPFRRLIPPIGGMDLSPIIIFILLQLAQSQIPC
ncbi:MAG: YggT family protein [Actinomycetota bacterium]|nr:YggT family protein [Actinomycetota bacterium]